VDSTSRGSEAADVARHLAGRFGASLVLLRAVSPKASSAEVIHSDETLSRQTQALREQGLDAHYTIAYDRPEQAIAQVAVAEETDLIIMAPHHRERLDALRCPSVTARMFGSAPVPVLVWPELTSGSVFSAFLSVAGSVVLVALDGSEEAEQVIPYAVLFAKEYRRPLVLVRVASRSPQVGIDAASHQLEVVRRNEELHEAARYLTSVRLKINREYAVAAQSMLLQGDPAHELLRIAETHNGSLMVMSTHGCTGFSRLLLGSVTASVMRETPLPLLVMSPLIQMTSRVHVLSQEVQHVPAI
jgi:nucleotide-binding universal stress UspA family protein